MSAPYKNDTIIKWLSTYFPRRHEWVHTNVNSVLAEDAEVGETNLTINAIPLWARANGGYIIIDLGTVEFEARHVTAAGIAGNVVTVSALAYAHAVYDNVLWITEPRISVEYAGAKCDSTGITTNGTDNLAAFNATMTQHILLGGTLWIPRIGSLAYRLSDAWKFASGANVESDYAWLYNSKTSGWGKNTLVIGTAGSWANAAENIYDVNPTGGSGAGPLTYYDVETVDKTSAVTFVTAGQSANLVAGDIAVLLSYDVFSNGAPLFVHCDIVNAVGAGTLTLRHATSDTFLSSAGNRSRIAKFNDHATLQGIDGVAPATILQNVRVSKLRLSNRLSTETLVASEWYGSFAACIGLNMQDIEFVEVANGIGTVALIESTLWNVGGNFGNSLADISYLSRDNLINIHGSRISTEDPFGALTTHTGIAAHEPGSCNTLFNCEVDMKGQGPNGLSLWQNHHGRVIGGKILNGGGATGSGIVTGDALSLDNDFNGVYLAGHLGTGIYVVSGARVRGCKVGPTTAAGKYGIHVYTGATEYIITDNEVGDKDTPRTPKDIIYTALAGADGGIVENNITYAGSVHSRFWQAIITTVNSNSTGDLYRHTIPANLITDGLGWHIIVGGYPNGAATKSIELYIGTDLLYQLNIGSGVTTGWRLEADLLYDGPQGRLNCIAVGFLGATVFATTMSRVLQLWAADVDLFVQAVVTGNGQAVCEYVNGDPVG